MNTATKLLATLALTSVALTGCSESHADGGHHEEAEHPIVLTNPAVMDVPTSRHFVCQIHSQRHIEVRALDEGYLQEIPVQEGQAVRQGQLLFKLLPVMYRARLDADRAELHLAEINLRNTRQLAEQGVVSDQELALANVERDRARAKVDLAAAEYGFTNIVAPFDGIMDRQLVQEGSLIEAGDILTTISNNQVMWVYFNVPEADYLRFKSRPGANDPEAPQRLEIPGAQIQIRLANGEIFGHDAETTLTIESDFDNETGNIKFRADFPNPERLLRHGQTGTLIINETMPDALVVPQRATFEILDRQYVYVVDEEGVAHQREITVGHELEDIYVVERGLEAGERVVFEGVRQVRDGRHLEDTQFVTPEEALRELKHHAE
ncbi:MAG: efflux transporter periplasmic adaptor subunit [Sandaracinus sp.]|nr:efflux transporter periplasmic adaptor subunit [Sandaracinus sp.]|tara:strand:+ start:212 stop:1348 length:1137 start_codon:yes stop_codon:yes gene_type:complete